MDWSLSSILADIEHPPFAIRSGGGGRRFVIQLEHLLTGGDDRTCNRLADNAAALY